MGDVQENFYTLNGRAERNAQAGNTREAIADWEKAFKLQPTDKDVKHNLCVAHYNIAVGLMNSGDYSGAKDEVQKALSYEFDSSAVKLDADLMRITSRLSPGSHIGPLETIFLIFEFDIIPVIVTGIQIGALIGAGIGIIFWIIISIMDGFRVGNLLLSLFGLAIIGAIAGAIIGLIVGIISAIRAIKKR